MGKVKKVVIDTNVFISGFGWGGKPDALLTLLKNNQIVCYFSPEIFEELKRVVSYPKLKFTESLQNKILEFVFFNCKLVEPKEHITVIVDDPDDNRFLECAVEANAEFVISGDPHLLRIGKYKTVEIVDVDKFLDIFSIEGD
ncbi:hypothetical protein BMS3Bbin06_02321 [bacterium BMS3Bbin06]|nr:hypothetical protein BMS3Abin08_01247 [bacterium BMS3Abin08]GBE35777.1 hypothetical protein BMS3Bbin06_02321 [bacterium BMS3Bbin06]HDY71081.1 putative toxin-antitoxin system toxin component, PIN family [Nitrospirota bacterium]